MKGIERVCEAKKRVFLGLGTNLGDREANLREAVEQIENLGLRIVQLSSVYETEPVGFADQNWFLNQVVEVAITPGLTLRLRKDAEAVIENCLEKDFEFGLKILAGELLSALLGIEDRMGRKREIADGPRLIDIDLLLFGDVVISAVLPINRWRGEAEAESLITIPHLRLHLRRFVLEPLCEIAPDVLHPVLNKSLTEILAGLADHCVVRVYQK